MSWGIAETASEIEKIKSESADYLNGLNSCGVIDWNTYNYAFDFYADLLMKAYKQGEKDAQPEPCEDAISKADMLETYADLYDVFEDNDQIRKELNKVYDKLNALPFVMPERKKGKWITQQFSSWAECSECHDWYGIESVQYNFCPNCGADMREEQDE